MTPTVDALLPLSFLEAVRAVDRPDEDPDAEFVAELRNKRLGLSDTVYAQIRRYAEAARRRQRQEADEVAGIVRLIARRPDAEAVFDAAGRYLGERAYAALPGHTRRAAHRLPALLARPFVYRQLRRLARRYFGGTVRRDGAGVVLEVPAALVGAGPHGAACAYYEAGFRELVQRLAGTAAAAVEHVHGDRPGGCRWRAEWAQGPAAPAAPAAADSAASAPATS